MKSHTTSVVGEHDVSHGSVAGYITGFVLSIFITAAAFLLATSDRLSGNALYLALAALAVTQLLVQLIFFLHLRKGSSAKWNILTLGFTGTVLVIVVFGSLWIMNHLNYNMMTPSQTNEYIQSEEAIKR